MRGKHQMTTFSQSEISDDIIFEEILTRLPVKSVVRFKSVSKKWYSTLSSSDFATVHLNKSPFSRPCAPIHSLFIGSTTYHYDPTYYLLPFDDNRISGNFQKGLVKLDVDFGDENKRLDVVGSCNGLICLARNCIGYTYFVLWNPATRKFNKYDGFIEAPQNVMCYSIACGFGYVSAVDDYKFVRIVSRIGRDGPHYSTVHVFSCRRNNWIILDYDLSAYFIGYSARLINEKLYWPSCSTSDDRKAAIISFDLGAEKFNIFHYPDLENGHLGIMGERLCMVAPGKIDILMPPTILKSISLPKDLQFGYEFEIVGFTRDGKLLMSGGEFYTASSALYLVNTYTEPLEFSKLMEFERPFSMLKYVPSLISPFIKAEP